ncbi:hypothetical protein VNO77_25911 [Canavalia gladiata]|uniref:Uncharacterized protein n=1 Tax=Canavalia gladiata TaxID=3824 RepID=A0AAN9KRM2_CANGL
MNSDAINVSVCHRTSLEAQVNRGTTNWGRGIFKVMNISGISGTAVAAYALDSTADPDLLSLVAHPIQFNWNLSLIGVLFFIGFSVAKMMITKSSLLLYKRYRLFMEGGKPIELTLPIKLLERFHSYWSISCRAIGVMVVCSDLKTIVNTALWVVTVAVLNIERTFESIIVLGNGKLFQGSGVSFSNLTRSNMYPLIFGEDVAAIFSPASTRYYSKTARNIVVCVADDSTVSRRTKKLILQMQEPWDDILYPWLHKLYQDSNASTLPTVEVTKYRPSPIVACFLSGFGTLQKTFSSFHYSKSTESGSVPIPIVKKPSLFGIKSDIRWQRKSDEQLVTNTGSLNATYTAMVHGSTHQRDWMSRLQNSGIEFPNKTQSSYLEKSSDPDLL